MKRVNLEEMTVNELVDRIAEIRVTQDQALLYGEAGHFRKLDWQMKDVDTELRARGQDARCPLQKLYDHPNMQVRLQAAKRTLAAARQAARQVIESVSDSNWFPQAGEAGMTLSNLNSGFFEPD
ncbi:MAG: DUF2019 domain-containing protein [Methylocella sp.]